VAAEPGGVSAADRLRSSVAGSEYLGRDRTQRLRLQSERGEWCDMLAPCAHDPAVGVNLFAMLLPWTTDVTEVVALDADGLAVT
jgi:hypothetical protein